MSFKSLTRLKSLSSNVITFKQYSRASLEPKLRQGVVGQSEKVNSTITIHTSERLVSYSTSFEPFPEISRAHFKNCS